MKEQEVINGRYLLHEALGKGGMGTVHRATDRLTGEVVALKQVLVSIDQILLHSFSASQTQRELRLTLATEFQFLASMHHPNIINVLDYGFSENKQPFFTMAYLAEAQTILAAGNGRSVTEKVQLLTQTLEALAYLHRRGILHRDLKPDNVLVADNIVRVLDFGLAISKDNATELVGSWLYVAPEVLQGEAASELSDLYAVGVIAYYLFAGEHPFDIYAEDVIGDILNKTPDMWKVQEKGVGEALTAVVAKLLAKDPQDRYATANETIQALNHAIGQPAPHESREIRESYLQAAAFVGRDNEMALLHSALLNAAKGHGSGWLIGGESGVGKSRLINELRIQALVDGFLVLRGQGIQNRSGSPYQIWREPLRKLILQLDPSDIDLSVLQPLIPNIGDLLERPVTPAPDLDETAVKQRLYSTIINLFQQNKQPTLLILDDLQWANESIELLKHLNRLTPDLPLLILGSYRIDEQPDLAADLSAMSFIPLPRLASTHVAELSIAMLGEAGRQPALLTLLQRETEGNAFFLVEVIRTLAENAGHLNKISQIALPTKLLPKGIQTIVQQRLDRVPLAAQRLLKLVAVAGRQVDTRLLQVLAHKTNIEQWFHICAAAAVLDFQERSWQFAHDKLREGLLASLAPRTLVSHHRRVAKAIEQVYADNPDYAARLVYHWQQAKVPEKVRHHAIIAGNHAFNQSANEDAISYLDTALRLTPESDWESHYSLLLAQEKVLDMMGDRAAQLQNLERLTVLAVQLEQTEKQAEVALRRANYYETIGKSPATVVTTIQETVAMAVAIGNQPLEAQARQLWGNLLRRQGHPEIAQAQIEKSLSIFQQIGDRKGEAAALNILGHLFVNQGKLDKAIDFFLASLATSRELGYQRGECTVLNSLGIAQAIQGNFAAAQESFVLARAISHQTGFKWVEGTVLNSLGNIAKLQGAIDEALAYYQDSLAIARLINDGNGMGSTLTNLVTVMHSLGVYEKANEYLEAALSVSREVGKAELEIDVLYTIGIMASKQERYEQARNYLEKCLGICREAGIQRSQEESLVALGHVAVAENKLDEARRHYLESIQLLERSNRKMIAAESWAGLGRIALAKGEVAEAFVYVHKILHYRAENPTFDGAERPFLIFLITIHILNAMQDPQATELLAAAYEILLDQASRIANLDMRHSFLENVPEHQEIVRLYKE